MERDSWFHSFQRHTLFQTKNNHNQEEKEEAMRDQRVKQKRLVIYNFKVIPPKIC